MICRPNFAVPLAVFISSIVLILASPFAVAHDFKRGEDVVILSNTHLEGKTPADPCGDAVWRGRPAMILDVDGERLLLDGERSGWLESQHVMLADSLAIDQINVWLTSEPSSAELYAARGFAWEACDEFDAAIADINLSIELQPDNAYWYFLRGLIRDGHDQNDEMFLDYQRAVALQPKFSRALAHVAEAMINQSKLDSAKEICDNLIADNPADNIAYHLRPGLASKEVSRVGGG